jgi:hypothetical protein
VKPVHLNLAAEPYRNRTPVIAVIVVASVFVAFLTLMNFDTWDRYRHDTRSTRGEIDRIEAQAAQERSRAEIAGSQLQRLDLARLNNQATFVNAKIAERTFSWSELLDRLELVLDRDVRLVSVAPSFGDGMVHLALSCEAKTATGLVDTLDRMQRDPHFRNPFPSGEVRNEGGTYSFQFTVDYLPEKGKR